jgi:hypothetical protein
MTDDQRPTSLDSDQTGQPPSPVGQSTDTLAAAVPDNGAVAGELVLDRWADVQRILTQAAGQADQATRATGKQLTGAAAAVREKASGADRFSSVGQQVASGLEQGGSYLTEHGARGAAGAVDRRWWVLLALLALGIVVVALSQRREEADHIVVAADVASG